MSRVALVMLLAMAAAVAVPVLDNYAADVDMSTLPSRVASAPDATSDELVDAGCADDVPSDALVKGPKVNGGFALNILPINVGDKRVANPDCAGFLIDGKCMKPLPRRSRTAGIEDNMQSPEQLSVSAFEPDVHKIVEQHFHQRVMQETQAEKQLAGLPGYEIIEEEMNKVDNVDADAVSDSMFPVGSALMHNEDTEVDVTSFSNLNHPAARDVQERPVSFVPGESAVVLNDPLWHVDSAVPVIGRTAQTVDPEPYDSIVSTAVLPSPTDLRARLANSPQEVSATGSSAETSAPDTAAVTTPVSETIAVLRRDLLAEQTAPVTSGADGSEVAMPLQAPGTVTAVAEEVGDLEETIPKPVYEAEVEILPSPSASPSPAFDPIVMQQRQAVAATQAREIAVCESLLTDSGFVCTARESDMALMQNDVAINFDAANVKGNFLSMIAHCTRVASEGFDASSASSVVQFSATLSKYASALSCAEGETFPACVPSEAGSIIQAAPQNGSWKCF